MTKCLFKALKAVDLEKHVGLFRSLGYDSAGALAHFHAENFDKLNFNEQELLRLIALLDVLKDATREGKICPHYFNSTNKLQQSNMKSAPIRASWSDETIPQRNLQSTIKKQSNENSKAKRSMSSIGITARSSSASISNHSNTFTMQRTATVTSRQTTRNNNQRVVGPKSFLNRPAVQHVKVKSYNYGVPTNRRSRNNSHRIHESNIHHGSIFVSSSHNTNDIISYGKPAEIYVYARKRPILSNETTFQDAITVPDNKRIIIAENKANLDCTPLLKKTEFQFDQVFSADASNKQVFEYTVLPFMSPTNRHNLTYICFGQTGSGKSHTIFGSKNTDGLLVYCTQLLLQELNFENNLIGSFYEIYNNQVYDLINPGKRLFVREDGEHHVNVIGVTEIVLRNLEDLRCVIDDGLTRRHHGKSAFNSNSSRSHAIFQIILKNSYNSTESFRLIFIDLAGSERATDAQNNQRQTRREGAQINWSLLALKECIRSMDMTHTHAPFRQSKLTHILRDSLVGSKTRTCLMANVSPPDDCCQCSLNTLQYASRIRDISIRHRHRSMPMTNIPMNYFDDTIKEQPIVREKPQRTFKPATASTPVHRLISSADQRIYMSTNQIDAEARTTKPIDIDWQIVDDDVPITGGDGGDNLSSKSREFLLNGNNNNQMQSNNQYLNRFQQQQKKTNETDQSPSSYFPLPQSDIKKSSSSKTSTDIKRPYDNSRLMYDDGNERQWKAVPAPSTGRLSDTSVEPPRMIPVAPIQMSDDNLYSSATGTESLGTKITKVAASGQRQKHVHTQNDLIESLNLNKQYDTGVMTTTDTEQGLYSDRQATHRDQTGFFTNRDDILSILSSRLTTGTQRSSSVTTPKKSKLKSHNGHSISSHSNKSKNSFSSPSKTRQKTRLVKSALSTTSLIDKKSSIDNKKTKFTSSINFQKFDPTIRRSPNRHHHHHQRTVPLRVQHSSDSEEQEKSRHRRKPYSSKNTSYSTRSDASHKAKNIHLQEKTEEKKNNMKNNEHSALITPNLSPLSTPSPSPILVPSTLVQAPLDQVTLLYNRSLQQLMSPSTANINNPWPISTSFSSPSKEFGVRVTDQLNALRTLLENRLVDHDEPKQVIKESSMLQTSPGTFARDFLQSFRQSSFQNQSPEFNSDIDDDDKEVARNFNDNKNNNNNNKQQQQHYEADVLSTSTTSSNQHGNYHHYEQIIQPSLSSLSDHLNQARVSSSVTSPSTSTITSNLAAKIDTLEPRALSSPGDGIHSQQSAGKNHPASIDNNVIHGIASNPTSDSERTSQVNSTSQNPFAPTSSGGSSSTGSRSRSPIVLAPFSTFDMANDHDHLLDSGKGSSLLRGSSFDALMNSLKSMRAKDLEFIQRTGDDKLIRVAD